MGSGPVRGLRGVVLEGCSKGARSSVLFSVAPPDFNRLRRTVLETLLFGKRAGARNVLGSAGCLGTVLEGARRCSKVLEIFCCLQSLRAAEAAPRFSFSDFPQK